MLKLNVNGTIYENGTGCKLYNLSAQELHVLDIYISTNDAAAYDWLLAPNDDGSAKISIEMDRCELGPGEFVAGQVFEIKEGNVGTSFSDPIIYKREERIYQGAVLDDSAHIQYLPSHNSTNQEPIRMIGGSTFSSVGDQWGRVRAVAPAGTTDENEFYDELSDWYINLATREDFVQLKVVPSGTTNTSLLDLHMQNITIVVQPSQHKALKKNYMYYDIDNEAPIIENIGVIY